MQIAIEDLTRPDVHALLMEHLTEMHKNSPAEGVHALGLEDLQANDVTFWTARTADELMGCAALKELDPQWGEIKSMRTTRAHLRKGVASELLEQLLGEARRRKYTRVSLETGSTEPFEAAKRLYERFGFTRCGAFADYEDDGFSLFMTLSL